MDRGNKIGVAVVGAAGWGSNVVRAFSQVPGAHLEWVCDLNPDVLARVGAQHPGCALTKSFEDTLRDGTVAAIAIAVDPVNHHRLAMQALAAGKHVLVEKPLTLSAAQSLELCELAAREGRVLMVGHLLLYHPAVLRARAAIDSGELGDILYMYSQRVNLGIVRENENAWWSLAPHDIAVAMYLLGGDPVSVSATGATYLQRERGVEDIAFAALRFSGGQMAHIHVSWLDPHKRRSLTVVGQKRMLTFDDTAPDERVKIYDKSAVPLPGHTSYAEGVAVRSGDVWSPAVPVREPLVAECEHFLECIRSGAKPRSDGRQGLMVVRVLEAGQRSLRAGGAPVEIGETS